MKLTTNVAKFEGQAALIIEVASTFLEGIEFWASPEETAIDAVSSWIQYCESTPAEERISSKRLAGPKGRVNLVYNNFDGNIKLQFQIKGKI